MNYLSLIASGLFGLIKKSPAMPGTFFIGVVWSPGSTPTVAGCRIGAADLLRGVEPSTSAQ